jgi:hypothetical protein
MRMIASYFKINQGSDTDYDVALDFINKFDKELAKLKITNPNGIALTFADFFASDPQDASNVRKIRELAIKLYDERNGLPLGFKGFNVLDVILNSKHFYQ